MPTKAQITAVFADEKGKIYDAPGLNPAGMKAGLFFKLKKKDFIKLPHGSEIFVLPKTTPIAFDSCAGGLVDLNKKYFLKNKSYNAVSAFVSPGYTATYTAAYKNIIQPNILPLFSYAAIGFYKGEFYAACIKVDKERRQDLRLMSLRDIKSGVKKIENIFPKNRLIKHLEKCALIYCCPAAKNFFLSRYEAPLPSSPVCNARCIGCISYQPDKKCSVTQPRIKFTPTPREIAQTALYHIKNVKDPVVSFGQGCEGEPLMVSDVLLDAIKLIRKNTARGVINLNTNASRPKELSKLFDAGLDSVRVSLNSLRKKYYNAYYKPMSYKFNDVLMSVKIARQKNKFISINYLSLPGFTDSRDEFEALKDFIAVYKIDMIQWRNLNYDPVKYLKDLNISIRREDMLGMNFIINAIHKKYPKLLKGYFNPSLLRIKRKKERE